MSVARSEQAVPSAGERSRQRRGIARRAAQAVVGLLFVIPVWWIVVNSTRSSTEIFSYLSPLSIQALIPTDLDLENYAVALRAGFGQALGNSIVVAGVTVVIGLFVCTTAAFALSVIPFRGQNLIFVVVLISFLIPFDAIAIPLASIFRDWSLINTYTGLILPGLGNGMAILLIRAFFLTIPGELSEAARIDGLGWPGIFWRIYLPNSKPVLIGAGLSLFLFQWQAYVWPLLVGTDNSHVLAPISLANMITANGVNYGALFAGATMFIAIPMVMILLLQRYFVQSVSASGIK
ncbi:MAG: carbohydrate ABC transporter permease [Microbacterium sp.]